MAMVSPLLQVLVSLEILVSAMASGCVPNPSCRVVGAQEQREFDYFLLSLQWPGTLCWRSLDCCSSNACCRGSNAPTEFTIHGLWTNYNDGTWPACCSSSNFDIKEISTLVDTLEKYWPSLTCDSWPTCDGGKGLFWAHEWEKHGTCSFPVIQGEYNYFLTTLNLYFKYNVTKVLNDAGYVTSNSERYPLGGIVSTIQNAFHATPSLTCSDDSVEELRLCFYKDFKPRDCVIRSSSQDDVPSSNNCPKYVRFPAFTSLRLGNGGDSSRLTQNEAL